MSNKKIKEYISNGQIDIKKIIKDYARICLCHYKK